MKDFHSSQKHIGLCCISPIIAAKVFGTASGGPGLKLTLGCRGDNWPYNGSIDAAKSFGNELVEVDLNGICYDEQNKVTTSPAYMRGDAKPHQIFDSVKLMVEKVSREIRKEKKEFPIVLIVDVEIKPERIDEFLKVFNINADSSRYETDVYTFDLLRDQQNSNKFTFYEAYKDEAAVTFHKQTAHYKAW